MADLTIDDIQVMIIDIKRHVKDGHNEEAHRLQDELFSSSIRFYQ